MEVVALGERELLGWRVRGEEMLEVEVRSRWELEVEGRVEDVDGVLGDGRGCVAEEGLVLRLRLFRRGVLVSIRGKRHRKRKQMEKEKLEERTEVRHLWATSKGSGLPAEPVVGQRRKRP